MVAENEFRRGITGGAAPHRMITKPDGTHGAKPVPVTKPAATNPPRPPSGGSGVSPSPDGRR
jgi:hypothetical protein